MGKVSIFARVGMVKYATENVTPEFRAYITQCRDSSVLRNYEINENIYNLTNPHSNLWQYKKGPPSLLKYNFT